MAKLAILTNTSVKLIFFANYNIGIYVKADGKTKQNVPEFNSERIIVVRLFFQLN